MHTATHDELDIQPSEDSLRADIKHYEQEAARIGDPKTLHQRGMQIVYKALALHRRKMLAALRDEPLHDEKGLS